MTTPETKPDVDRPLRIAFLTPEFVTEPKFDGGLANYLVRVALALKAAGHHPEIFVATDRTETIVHEGLVVHRVRTFSPTTMRCMKLISRFFGYPWCATWELLCIARSLSRHFSACHVDDPFDVVQASDFQAPALCVSARSIPVVVRLSYFAPFWRAPDSPVSLDRRWRERLECNAVTQAIRAYAPSRFIAQSAGAALNRTVDILPPPVLVGAVSASPASLPEGVAPDKFILFFGRVSWVKGAHVLGPAIVRILLERPDWRLVIVGREDPPGIVSTIRAALGSASDQLIHVERLPHHVLYPIVRAAAVVCLPSMVDNFPNTCVEAMSMGRIVVGTRGRGFDELIEDRVSGFLADVNNPASFESAIREALAQPIEARRAMQAAAAVSIERYRPEKAVPALVAYYREAIHMHQTGGCGS